MALASLGLFAYQFFHGRRYAGYSHTIWDRLRIIEDETGMKLHTQIDKDRLLEWTLLWVNLGLLLF